MIYYKTDLLILFRNPVASHDEADERGGGITSRWLDIPVTPPARQATRAASRYWG
jgi:hypothetical protein